MVYFLQVVLRTTINQIYSITQIHRILKRLNITRKRTKRIVRKSEAYISMLKEKRNVFIQRMHAKRIQDVISIDESGFQKQMGSKYAYAPSGTKVYHQTTSQRHQNYSLILAISSSLVIASKILKGGVKKEAFHAFLNDELLPACGTRKYTFLLDNVRFHHSKSIKQLIISHGHSIEYTPPYSPDLNPVECVFSVLKSKVRKQHCLTVTELITFLNNTLAQIHGFEKMFMHSLTGSELSNEGRSRIILFNNKTSS